MVVRKAVGGRADARLLVFANMLHIIELMSRPESDIDKLMGFMTDSCAALRERMKFSRTNIC